MKRSYNFWPVLGVLLSALFLVACPNPANDEGKTASIDIVGWVLDNSHGNYWPNPSTETASLDVFVYFEDTSLQANDIDYIKISNPRNDWHWSFNSNNIDVVELNNPEKRRASFTLFDGNSDGHSIDLGTYTIEAKLKNGSSDTYALYVPAPGSKLTDGNHLAYTEDSTYYGETSPGTIQLLHRAEITSATSDGTSVTVEWTVTDDRVNNGILLFRDSENKLIGGSTNPLYDPIKDTVSASCNNGTAFHTDGTSNTVVHDASSITFYDDNKNVSDIAKVAVKLYDGKQYPGTYYYDSISRTASEAVE